MHQRGCQGVSQRDGDQGTRGRHQVVRVAFAIHARVQHGITSPGQRAVDVAENANQRGAQLLQFRQQPHELFRGAALGDQDDHIAGRHQTEIAVHRFGRVQIGGRGARGTQRGRQLTRHEAALADAAGDDFPAARQDEFHCPLEASIQTRRSPREGTGFGIQ